MSATTAMKLTLNEHKAKHIDVKGADLAMRILSEPHQRNPAQKQPSPFPEHLKEKKVMDLTAFQVGFEDEYVEDPSGRRFERRRKLDDKILGYDQEGYSEVCALAGVFLKERAFAGLISRSFLEDAIFDWLIETHEGKHTEPLSGHILKIANERVEFVTVYIPVLYLESDIKFVLGAASFGYITEAYIQELAGKVQDSNGADFVEGLRAYRGQLYAICVIEAEKGRAVEVAVEYSTIALDMLRLFSPTVQLPEFRCFFDLDFRNVHQAGSLILTQKLSKPDSVSITRSHKPKPFVVNDTFWRIMNEDGLRRVHDFVMRTREERSELDRLIHGAIANFSRAIALFDVHERVVQLFTVLESLLLPGDSSPIIDSVCKYLPKIITANPEERKLVMATVRQMYGIRSAVIHHAQKRQFETNDLRTLQICTRALIINMISHSYHKKEKHQVLKEIDDRINSA